jgi:hypothetical protein
MEPLNTPSPQQVDDALGDIERRAHQIGSGRDDNRLVTALCVGVWVLMVALGGKVQDALAAIRQFHDFGDGPLAPTPDTAPDSSGNEPADEDDLLGTIEHQLDALEPLLDDGSEPTSLEGVACNTPPAECVLPVVIHGSAEDAALVVAAPDVMPGVPLGTPPGDDANQHEEPAATH